MSVERVPMQLGCLSVEGIERHFRASIPIKGTSVLVLKNVSGATADFRLKCFTRSHAAKTFNVALAVGDKKEIGWLEGWDKNFLAGEYCTAEIDDTQVWKIVVPPVK